MTHVVGLTEEGEEGEHSTGNLVLLIDTMLRVVQEMKNDMVIVLHFSSILRNLSCNRMFFSFSSLLIMTMTMMMMMMMMTMMMVDDWWLGRIYNVLALNQVWLTTLIDIITSVHAEYSTNDGHEEREDSLCALNGLMFVQQDLHNPHGKWDGLIVLISNVMRIITNLTMLNRMWWW